MKSLVIRGDLLLLALDWNDYLGRFKPIDDWKPNGDYPPSENPQGFVMEDEDLVRIATTYLDEDESEIPVCFGSLHDGSPRLALLRAFLAANPALQALPLEIAPIFDRDDAGGLEIAQPDEAFERFLRKLASGDLKPADLKAAG